MTELECSDMSTPHRGVYGRRKRQTLQRIAGLKASLQSLVLSPSTAIDHSIAVPIPSLAVSAASISPEHPKAYLHSLAKAHHDVEVLTKQNHMLIEQCEALRLHGEDPSQQQVALCPREEQEELHQIVDAAVALLRTVATCYPALLSETAQRLVVGEDGEGSPLGPEEAADELCAGLWRLEKLLPALAPGHQTPLPDLAAEAMEIASALQVDHQEDGQRLLQLVGALGRAIENDRERAAEREATLQRSEERVNELNEVIHNQTQASTDATEAEEDRASRVSLAVALSSLEGLREQLRNEEARAQALSTQRDEAEQIVSQASDRLAEAKAACEREKTAAVAAEAALQNLQQELLESRESAAGAAAMREEMLTLSRRVAQAQEQLESTERDRLAAEDYGMERQRRYDELHMALKRLHTVLLAVAEASTSSQDVDQKGSSEEWPAEVSDLVAVACGLRQSMAELRREAIDAQATGTGLLSLRPDVVEGMQRETLVLYQENARYRQQLENLLGAIESQSVEGDEDS